MDTFMDKLASKLNAQEMIRANSAAEAKENERLHKEVEAYKQCLEQLRELSRQNATAGDSVAELVKASMDKIAAIQAESGKSDEVLAIMQGQSEEVKGTVQNASEEVIASVKHSSEVVISSIRNTMQGNADSVVNAVAGNADSILGAIGENSDKILAELQKGNDDFKDAIVSALLAEMKKELKAQEEVIHKECVKVYRNVQAVITDENEKQTKAILDVQNKMKKKATAALVCGILAMSFAAAGLAVSLLDIFGVFAMLF